MLQCEYCDYHKKLSVSSVENGGQTSVCEFTGFIFTRDVNELNIEHPCRSASYQSYLDRKKNLQTAVSFEEDDWKVTYKKYHTKPAKEKDRISA